MLNALLRRFGNVFQHPIRSTKTPGWCTPGTPFPAQPAPCTRTRRRQGPMAQSIAGAQAPTEEPTYFAAVSQLRRNPRRDLPAPAPSSGTAHAQGVLVARREDGLFAQLGRYVRKGLLRAVLAWRAAGRGYRRFSCVEPGVVLGGQPPHDNVAGCSAARRDAFTAGARCVFWEARSTIWYDESPKRSGLCRRNTRIRPACQGAVRDYVRAILRGATAGFRRAAPRHRVGRRRVPA